MTVPTAKLRPGSIFLLGLAFIAFALATRLPVRDRTLFISDSGRYALALERYDMTAGRPHPPGNPLYIGLARRSTESSTIRRRPSPSSAP
jgi:hypothetical protein